MGRKKRKQLKPWCWYCNREFDDEKILIQHQKAKHFKCPYCHRKLYTGPGLSIHCNQVHKEKLDKIPNSLPNRCSTVIDIYGMAGIPEGDLIDHERVKLGLEDDEPPEKITRTEEPSTSFTQGLIPPPLIPGTIPPFMPPVCVGPYVPPQLVLPTPPIMSAPVLNSPVESVTPKATFPAYSTETKVDEPVPKVPKPTCGANGVSVELVHPDEDLSLEELRLLTPKYKRLLDAARAPPIVPTTVALPPAQNVPMSTVPQMHPAMMHPQYRMAHMLPIPPMPYGASAPFIPSNLVPGMQGIPYGAAPPPWTGMPNVRF